MRTKPAKLVPINGMRLRHHRQETKSPFRTNAYMSQAELSRIAGVSRSYIAEIEGGIKQPSMLVARALANALEVNLDDLISS